MATFSRLVRFLAKDGQTYYGDALLSAGVSDIAQATRARVIRGDIFGQHQVTDQIADIKMLLAPLARKDIGTVRCLGLNYEQHAIESNLPLPKFPVLFYKPVTSVTGPTDDVPVSRMAQQGEGLDYECELVVVIGKEAKNVPESQALDYVLGYAVGNDVSHREWQLKHGGGQWGLGKGFDGWAPFGPDLDKTEWPDGPIIIHQGYDLQGGQDSVVLISGYHLVAGDVIFTGTPQGVGMGRKPALWLKDGDLVEVSLEGVGSCLNRVVFDKPSSKL